MTARFSASAAVRVVPRTDAAYPKPLCDLADPPAQLHVAGQLPDWSHVAAVVGTRRPQPQAAAFARTLGRELAEAGWVVVAGGAFGIDSDAHRGALEAGGITVAVLGSSLIRPYPRENISLFREISERGCVLSEVDANDPMYPLRFIQRNRLIAALSKVVVVVEAPVSSGALSTAAFARKLARVVLAVPHAPWDPIGAGGVDLLAHGAGICRDSRDVLLLSAAGAQKRPVQQTARTAGRPRKVTEYQGLDDDQRAVLAALSGAPRAADEVCEATGLPAPRVQRAILMLLLSKVVQELGSGSYQRSDHR